VSALAVTAAEKVGAEILSDILKIASSPGGLEWLAENLFEKKKHLKEAIEAMKPVPVAEETPDART
jgi:hypothetical protein